MISHIDMAFVFASSAEADPFLQNVSARRTISMSYPIYHSYIAGHNTVILITGMGVNAALAGMRILTAYYETDMLFNCGVAGSLGDKFSLGDIVNVDDAGIVNSKTEIYDVRFMPVDGKYLGPYPGCRLVTVTEPLFDSEHKKLLSRFAQVVDMEGAVIVEFCASKGIPCQLIKIISDRADDRKTLEANLYSMSSMLAYTLTEDLYEFLDRKACV